MRNHLTILRLPLAVLMLLGSSACAVHRGAPPAEERSLADEVADAVRVAQVQMVLLEQLGADALTIRAEVQGRRATLRGDVKKRSTQELAEEIARSVSGIERVENRLRLIDPSPEAGRFEKASQTASDEVSDAALETRVNLKLLGELGRHALSLEVEATDGVVSLRGTLPDAERKRVALRAAEGVNGVEKVLDLLKVSR